MSVGVWQVLLIVAVVALLFGGKRLGKLGGDLGRGLRSIRKSLSSPAEETEEPEGAPKKTSKKVSKKGQQDWVKSAAEVAKTAQQVRKATRLGRRFPFG